MKKRPEAIADPQDRELARRLFRRCEELFGPGCTAVVRKKDKRDAERVQHGS